MNRFALLRRFTYLAVLAVATSAWAIGSPNPLHLVIDSDLPPAASRSAADLDASLQRIRSQGERLRALPDLTQNRTEALVIGIAGESPLVDRLLQEHKISLADSPESYSIQRIPNSKQLTLVAGRDARGLSYAILDLARGFETRYRSLSPTSLVVDASESPYLKVRSVSIHLFNSDVERGWFFDEAHWQAYFKLLAQSRFNNFILTLTDQTNYLNPPYSYFVDVPGFSQVKVANVSDEGRQRNLAMLRRIGELAHERGISFTLGIWTQLPVAKYTPKAQVTGLPTGADAATYCAAGMGELLKQCPTIDGIQFRMNAEAGVAEDEQTAFYHPLFEAIAKCGRKIPLDLRYKGLRPETIAGARALGLDVTVSTKFWCEHFGLPYHPTTADKLYRESRYSYGKMLAKPRDYRVVYQLWTVGSQRLLLWGDPEYGARFAESCKLGDGEGFEVFAPLTDKGFGNAPGDWRIFAKAEDELGRFEFERYWMFYLSFGRLGYNPKCNPEIWRREFASRFGAAGKHIEAAYREASRILPLVTASHQLSGGEWVWWPEMDTGDRLTEYMHVQPSDTRQFYGIRNWKATPDWRSDAWDPQPSGFVEDAVAGRLSARETPLEVSRRLRAYAFETNKHLEATSFQIRDSGLREWQSTLVDLKMLAELGSYHAEKKLAATELAFFEVTKDAARLPHALEHAKAAASHWQSMGNLASRLYSSNLVFGYSPHDGRRKGHHHSGHWKDRLPEVQADVAYLESLIAKNPASSAAVRRFPGENPVSTRNAVQHVAATQTRSDADLPLSVKVVGSTPPTKVVLHFRTVDQTADWKLVEMKPGLGGDYHATISHKDILAKFDLQYYFEILSGTEGGWIYPSRDERTPYFVVPVEN